MKPRFSTDLQYIYYDRNIGNFKRYKKIREQQTYIWYGYAYFEKAIVHYSNYEWLYPILSKKLVN